MKKKRKLTKSERILEIRKREISREFRELRLTLKQVNLSPMLKEAAEKRMANLLDMKSHLEKL